MHRRTSRITFFQSHELRHNQTEAESKLWKNLRSHHFEGVHFRRQHAIGPYIVDFCAPRQRLIIELDGGQHMENQAYDDARTAFLELKGYRVLRIWNNEVMNNLEGVLNAIHDSFGADDDPPQSPHFHKAENGGR